MSLLSFLFANFMKYKAFNSTGCVSIGCWAFKMWSFLEAHHQDVVIFRWSVKTTTNSSKNKIVSCEVS